MIKEATSRVFGNSRPESLWRGNMSVLIAEGTGNVGLHIFPDSLGVWRGVAGVVLRPAGGRRD